MKKRSYRHEDDPLDLFNRRLIRFRPWFFGGLALILVLLNFRYIPLWPLPAFALASAAYVLWLAGTTMTCPQCRYNLFRLSSLLTLDQCPRCYFTFSRPETDPARFTAELARQFPETGWSPLATRTANFDTFRLIPAKGDRLVLRPTLKARAFHISSLAMGFLFILVGMLVFAPLWPQTDIPVLIRLAPLVFVLAGLFFAREGWKSLARRTIIKIDPTKGITPEGPVKDRPLAPRDMHAIQLLARRVNTSTRHRLPQRSFHVKQSSYYLCYEINLVLRGGRRQHLAPFASRIKALQAAERIAIHLGLPLWNGL